MRGGDTAAVSGEDRLTMTGRDPGSSELLLFDLARPTGRAAIGSRFAEKADGAPEGRRAVGTDRDSI